MIMPLGYAYCNVPVMPVRREAMHSAEQVTQLLFGERVEIIEVNNRDWARVLVSWDEYEGWCKMSQLTTFNNVKEYRKAAKYMTGSHKDKLVMDNGEVSLPMGSELVAIRRSKVRVVHEWGKLKAKKLNINKLSLTSDNLKTAAYKYLHAPYDWGGRSITGIDCSGLTQMAFKLCNHKIPRDASQQANQGILVDFLQNAQCGDLAFFDNKEGKIVHVGILLDNQTIIHATDTAGRVVVDRIDQAGIISTTLKMRTHNLRFVKRIIGS